MTTLSNLDSNEIGRYDETTPIGSGGTPTFSEYLNAALESVSAAFTKYVRRETIRKRTNPATIASSTSYSALTMNAAVIGSDFTHSAGVFTCVNPGEYRIRFNASFAGSATGTRGVRLAGSGAIGNRQVQHNAVGSLDYLIGIEWIVTLAAGDTITTQVQQNSGSGMTILADVTFERVV